MCLGIPGKVVEIYEKRNLRMGKIDFGGVVKEACLSYLPDIKVGEYAIIHVGFAITQLDEDEAMETLRLLRELDLAGEELGENVENGLQ